MSQDKGQSVADVEGPWVDPEFDSGLIASLRRDWTIPVNELTNGALARFIRQRIALQLVVPEARKRIEARFDDDSELYDGELAEALNDLGGNV